MADFEVSYTSGSTLYVRVERLRDGDSHTVSLTDNGDDTYEGNMPSDAGLGQYQCDLYKQSGASPDTDDDTILYPIGVRIWSGSEFDFDKAVAAAQGTYRSSFMTFENRRS